MAPTDSTVLLLGETGTGKELVARAIHQLSARAGAPSSSSTARPSRRTCSRASCSATRRAPSPARSRRRSAASSWRTAARCSSTRSARSRAPLQAKLLRVLQEREFERVGGTRTQRVDVRLVAATNRDLRRTGRARASSARTSTTASTSSRSSCRRCASAARTFPRSSPHFVERVLAARSASASTPSSPPTMAAFEAYDWPGNVRELQNVIERAVILADDGVLPNPLPRGACGRPRQAAADDGAGDAAGFRARADPQRARSGRLGGRRPGRCGGPARLEPHDPDQHDEEARHRASHAGRPRPGRKPSGRRGARPRSESDGTGEKAAAPLGRRIRPVPRRARRCARPQQAAGVHENRREFPASPACLTDQRHPALHGLQALAAFTARHDCCPKRGCAGSRRPDRFTLDQASGGSGSWKAKPAQQTVCASSAR